MSDVANTLFRIRNGLAVYEMGEGEPLLLMPYPHGFATGPAAEGPLAQLIAGLGRRVLTFDPPGAFRSTRPAQVSIEEMLAGAVETLCECDVAGPLDIIGHSMGGLVALAFALEHPDMVKRMMLIGSVCGGPAIRRCRGMPWNWRWTKLDFWRFAFLGLRLISIGGNLAVHKHLLHLLRRPSYHDQSMVPPLRIEHGDTHRPAPVRDRWPLVARHLDYCHRLGEVRSPTLVCAGRFDPQAPVACAGELAAGIPQAHLVIFEESGHYPFIEEAERFGQEVDAFLSSPPVGAAASG